MVDSGEYAKVELTVTPNPGNPSKPWKNITTFLGVGSEDDVKIPEETTKAPKPKFDNCKTMYTSYAKDVFIGLLTLHNGERESTELMIKAIELVKQARDSF